MFTDTAIDWPLHGARNVAELGRVIDALAEWARAPRRLPRSNSEAYAYIGVRFGIPTGTVAKIACSYQSLWLAP